MYDYFLGGKDNYYGDREAADKIMAKAPDAPGACRANRAFLGRAVRFVACQGVQQFIDIGAGLPTQGNVHEVAHQVAPESRIVYVDNDPIVLAHGRALLPKDDTIAIIDADMRQPHAILDHPATAKLIDFSQPLAVLFVAALHFVTDEEDPAGIIRAFGERMAPGSYLILSHDTTEGHAGELLELGKDVYRHATSPMNFRSREEILLFFGDFELVPPGVTPLNQWRPDNLAEANQPGAHWLLAGVGRRKDK
ncbi:MAG: SAM-dependent methyltransferase [Streptosporangiales bacterium]|nr:SAM-dependent methyltransferase [Streptosporangiales bacterium]